jgi:hypothetical protein
MWAIVKGFYKRGRLTNHFVMTAPLSRSSLGGSAPLHGDWETMHFEHRLGCDCGVVAQRGESASL